MQSITTIGLDIAKSVFQVHGIDAAGRVVMRRQLKRYVKRHKNDVLVATNRMFAPAGLHGVEQLLSRAQLAEFGI